jgi:hypothetical protein
MGEVVDMEHGAEFDEIGGKCKRVSLFGRSVGC